MPGCAKGRAVRLTLLLWVTGLALACSQPTSRQPAAQPPQAPRAPDLKVVAESQQLAAMTPALAELIRGQTWFTTLTQSQLDLVVSIRKCELSAKRRGQTDSVASLLQFASEQSWYADGLDDRETAVLVGLFEAYGESLENPNAPAIGPFISSTIKGQLFEVIELPETGRMVILVAATDQKVGRKALNLATDALPKIEKIVGAYPYHFLYIEVTRDLPPFAAGLSYDQFIALDDRYVDVATVTHEITHSTVYGIYPIWFEEGLAHFLEHYLTDSLDAGVRDYSRDLARGSNDAKLDLRRRGSTMDAVDRARGFLFLKAFYDIRGIEGVSEAVHSLRKKTATDQELIRVLVQGSPPDQQRRVSQLVCDRVIGTTHNYCAAP